MAKLTKEQIKEFKETESDAEASYDFKSLADDVADADDKEWASKLYKKAEELAEEKDDYQSLADSVVADDYLGDKKWDIEDFRKSFKSKNRLKCAAPAPACGLYLISIAY